MKQTSKIFLFILSCLGASALQAYPSMIRYGYNQCSACHESPHGGANLNSYGRGVADSGSLFGLNYDEPKANWWKKATLDGQWLHGGEARGMILDKSTDGLKVFPMQLDYLAAIHPSYEPLKKLRGEIQFGYLPEEGQSGSGNSFFKNFVARRAYAAYAIVEDAEIAAGRDYLPVGLNIDNHSSLIRKRNRRDVGDFATVLRADYWKKYGFATVFVSAPSFQEAPDNQEYATGFRFEGFLNDTATLGSSYLFGKSDSMTRHLATLFSRYAINEQFGALLEYDWTLRDPKISKAFQQHTLYAMPFFSPKEYVEIGAPAEFLKVTSPYEERVWRAGPQVLFRWTYFISSLAGYRWEQKEHNHEWVFYAQVFAHY